MMHDSAIHETIEITVENGKSSRLGLVGPGAQGWIYRNEDQSAVFRILSVKGRSAKARGAPRRYSDDAPIERRHEIANWTENSQSGDGRPDWLARAGAGQLVPPGAADMIDLPGSGVFFSIRYDCPANRFLTDVLADPDILIRIEHMGRVLLGFHRWWDILGAGVLPLPSDIVFGEDGRAMLLALPYWRLPDADAVNMAPERAFYLPPEYTRGTEPMVMGLNADRYGLGALLLQCFFQPPKAEPSNLLLRAAMGKLWTQALPCCLPYWQRQAAGFRDVIAMVRRLTDLSPQVRSSVDLNKLTKKWQMLPKRIHPQNVLNELVNNGKWGDADGLLQDVLLVDESYDTLCLAAEIASRCGRPMEGMQYCEKAIEKQPKDTKAYLQQFQILVSDKAREKLQVVIDNRTDLGKRIDEQVVRDFISMPPHWQTDDRLKSLVEHMLWRRDYSKAAELLRLKLSSPPALPDDDEISRLRLPLRLLYVEALGREEAGKTTPGQCVRARQEIARIRKDIRALFSRGYLTPDSLEFCGEFIRKLEWMVDGLEGKLK